MSDQSKLNWKDMTRNIYAAEIIKQMYDLTFETSEQDVKTVKSKYNKAIENLNAEFVCPGLDAYVFPAPDSFHEQAKLMHKIHTEWNGVFYLGYGRERESASNFALRLAYRLKFGEHLIMANEDPPVKNEAPGQISMEELEKLKAYQIAVENREEVCAIMLASNRQDTAKEALMLRYEVTKKQAETIMAASIDYVKKQLEEMSTWESLIQEVI